MNTDYDIIIIGAGPSGVASAIYAKRSGLKTLLVEQNVIGGQVVNSSEIKNIPGFSSITGPDFAYKLYEQLNENDIEILYSKPQEYELNDKIKKVIFSNKILTCKAIVFCVGAKAKSLRLQDEEKLIGKGISYCAICDGNFFKDKNVAIVGGGDSALEDSVYLSGLCKKVYVIVRKNSFKGQKILVESLNNCINKNKNIEVLFDSQVTKLIQENEKLNKINIINLNTNAEIQLQVEGLFIAVGRIPATESLQNKILLDDNGYIIVDDKFQTNINGVFAGGDCINKDIKQILTASSFGAMATTYAFKYIQENF